MSSILWTLKTHNTPVLMFHMLIMFLLGYLFFQSDFVFLVMTYFYRHAIGKADLFVSGAKFCPTGLVIIPSLLRNDEDYDGMILAIDSCANNGYPSSLVIIVSIDGNLERPDLYKKLLDWGNQQSYPSNVHLFITGTEKRRGKMMAVHAGAEHMQCLIDNGKFGFFPQVYFSFDADGILSLNSFERLATKLATPTFWTKNPRRVVAGKMLIRKELVWNGWQAFFTVKGQIYLQVASQFMKACVARYNWRLVPKIGLSGVLYATWSDLLVQAPAYMGFLQSLKWSDCIKWWLGFPPPFFTESKADPLPEALTGATDDTSMSFIVMLSSWKNGKLSLDAPRTPMHAFGRLIREFIIERSHDYDAEARVYTYTPSTIKGLWTQRIRWNSARIECSMRFTKAMFFHLELAFVILYQFVFYFKSVAVNVIMYMLIPYMIIRGTDIVSALFFFYVYYTVSAFVYTVMALMIEREYRSYWRVLLCSPFTMIFGIVINTMTQVYGTLRELLFFGNQVRFVPEETLIRGKTERIAILYRVRRFLLLCIRSVLHGDVPLGSYWLGWREHLPYVESGYKGWTSGKRSQYFVR